jgi:hypothetical protein
MIKNDIILENIALKNRVKELEESCTCFIEVESNLHRKIKLLNLEIENLKEDLYYYIEKYGTSHELTIIKSQEVDIKLNKLDFISRNITL